MFPPPWVLLPLFTVVSARVISSPNQFKHKIGSLSQSGSVCVNGDLVDGKCRCHFDFVGTHCEKEMHCDSFERKKDGSCMKGCEEGFSGLFCENIVCVRGTMDDWGTGCICNAPYQGRFCDELTMEKTYSFYNNKILTIGPLGALSIIPMSFIYWYFERNAKKRELTKLSESMEEQNIRVPNGRLEYLLKN